MKILYLAVAEIFLAYVKHLRKNSLYFSWIVLQEFFKIIFLFSLMMKSKVLMSNQTRLYYQHP